MLLNQIGAEQTSDNGRKALKESTTTNPTEGVIKLLSSGPDAPDLSSALVGHGSRTYLQWCPCPLLLSVGEDRSCAASPAQSAVILAVQILGREAVFIGAFCSLHMEHGLL